MAINKKRIYTVSQVNALIKNALENSLPGRMTVTGQISDWKLHGSGHCYFSLKDEDSILHCVMWRSSFSRLKFRPENGMAILATGYIDIYPPQGKVQFYAERMEPAGVGALALAFEQMKNTLASEGLFNDEHKKPLPPYPMRICVLTSESGAAMHDIVDSIQNRWPCVKLALYPVPVQGAGAAEKIASAIADVNRRNNELKFDMMIVGRGGGSMEDLWAFNEEVLARAIFNSEIPIVSAVGHEVDITIADFVADVRASTPTKAGVVAVPDAEEVLSKLVYAKDRLTEKMQWMIHLNEQRIDEAGFTLSDLIRETLSQLKVRLNDFFEQVLSIEPHRLLGKKAASLNNLDNRINKAVEARMNQKRLGLTAMSNRLRGLNPRAVLKRGYSITKNKRTSQVVKSLSDVEISDVIVTELGDDNLLESEVTKT